MKDYIAPIVASVAVAIILAIASLFSDVQSNRDDVETVERDVDRLRGYVVENHDDIIVIKERQAK